ncbi:MAG TPA: hypothetical protein VFQ53_09160 [Kofleriaceae bacterium]|nr:hypothetical protein [Kofleriaceae bacterium]
MSSSFFVPLEGVPDVASTIAALDRPGVRWADGELATLDDWPERSLLLYIPGVSSRGVECVRDGMEMKVRLLVLSTEGDYDLAFRLVEVLGRTATVSVEGGDPTPANRVRAVCGGDWMTRDRAVGLAAMRASLAAGHAVEITGPVRGLAVATAADVDDVPERLRALQIAEPDADERAGLAVVLHGGRLDAYHGPIATRALAVLAAGPEGLTDRVRELPRAEAVDYAFLDAGWIVDLDDRVVIVARWGDRGDKPDLARWDGFTITRADTPVALAAYLGARGLGLPPVRTHDDDPAWDAVVGAIALGAQEHRAKLDADERAVGKPASRSSPIGMALIAIAFLVVVIPALVVRLLTIPLRGWLRDREPRRRAPRPELPRDELVEVHAKLAAQPDDLELRQRRAELCLQRGWWAEADRDFAVCLARLDAGAAPGKVVRGAVLHNLGVTRTLLRCPQLAERARVAAKQAGFVLRAPVHRRAWHAIATYGVVVGGMFAVIAGLAPD